MLEDDLPGFLGFVRFRLSHRPSRLGTHPRQSRINDYRAHLACFPFNFTPEQTKLFDRMLRYKTPPNAASSALRLLHQRLTAKPPHIPDAVSSTPPLRYNEDTFAGLSPHRPPCQKPPT
jgi:hypothetical protein